jgi:hypothetical protein
MYETDLTFQPHFLPCFDTNDTRQLIVKSIELQNLLEQITGLSNLELMILQHAIYYRLNGY